MFETSRRRRSIWRMQILGILVVIVYVVGQFITFQLSLSRLPPTWTVAGRSFPDLPIDEVMQQLATDLQQPIALHYLTRTLTLQPSAIDFTFDAGTTARRIKIARSQNAALGDFLLHLIFQPPAPRDLPVDVSYSDEKLRAQLAEIGSRYDHPAQPPAPDPASMTLSPGQPGYQLDIVASVGPIETALKSAGKRDAELVVENQPAPNPGIDQLTLLLQARLAQFPGKTSLFLKDLQTGHEIDLNPHVAYSGLSLTKIALAVEVYRRLDQPPDAQTTALVTETLGLEDSDAAANQLLAMIGDGSAQAGVEDLTSSMHNVGLVDTFMTAAYGVTDTAESLVTPANSNPAAGTVPDPARQTTPTDIGLLLEMIYQCSHSGGALLAVYPDKFTPAECNQMLDLMKQNAPQTTEGVPPLLKGGVPDTVEVAHKLGGDFDTRADAAIMSTPGGDYVLVVFLTTPGQWVDWNVADGVMVDVSRAAYHFFNPTVQ